MVERLGEMWKGRRERIEKGSRERIEKRQKEVEKTGGGTKRNKETISHGQVTQGSHKYN